MQTYQGFAVVLALSQCVFYLVATLCIIVLTRGVRALLWSITRERECRLRLLERQEDK
jgi:hypothetical protein